MQRPSPETIFRSHKMRFGAEVRNGGTRFKIWAPKCKAIKLKLKGQRLLIDLDAIGDGWHRIDVDGVGAGTLYKYVLPDGTAIPDPTSRHQPEGIHGYSEVIDRETSSGPTAIGRDAHGKRRSSTNSMSGHSPRRAHSPLPPPVWITWSTLVSPRFRSCRSLNSMANSIGATMERCGSPRHPAMGVQTPLTGGR